MFNKKLQDLTYQDLEDLIYIQQVGEGYNLDFKGEPKNIDDFSNKLLRKRFKITQLDNKHL